MPKLPVILTLVLIVAWGYTSWNWYVCNIKGLCDMPQIQKNEKNQNHLSYSDVAIKQVPEEVDAEEVDAEDVSVSTGSLYSSPKLSADDVLRDNPKPKVVVEEKQTPDIIIEVSSGSTDTLKNEDTEEIKKSVKEVVSLCQKPLLGPIGLGTVNDSDEVERLEAFLIARGEKIEINGIYGQDDFDAVKRFQLEYRADILDPWDINNPTGYVYKTTVKKINEIACK